jgi:hypothetical protein
MEDKSISEKESLFIIQQMIATAKKEQRDDGIDWIIWGWLLFATSILTYANLYFKWFSEAFFWNIFGIISLLLLGYSSISYFFFKKVRRVKTYTGDLFEKLNIGFFIFLVFIIFSMNMGVGAVKGFAYLIALYGFWILIYGTALNFKPSIVAAFITWAIGFVALIINKLENSVEEQFKWIMILHALAVLCGYIIPGHMANKEFKKINRQENTLRHSV